jgi:hypothetical protein
MQRKRQSLIRKDYFTGWDESDRDAPGTMPLSTPFSKIRLLFGLAEIAVAPIAGHR